MEEHPPRETPLERVVAVEEQVEEAPPSPTALEAGLKAYEEGEVEARVGLTWFAAGLLLMVLVLPWALKAAGWVDYPQALDLLKTYVAMVSGLVGAVWGYYFRRG